VREREAQWTIEEEGEKRDREKERDGGRKEREKERRNDL